MAVAHTLTHGYGISGGLVGTGALVLGLGYKAGVVGAATASRTIVVKPEDRITKVSKRRSILVPPEDRTHEPN